MSAMRGAWKANVRQPPCGVGRVACNVKVKLKEGVWDVFGEVGVGEGEVVICQTSIISVMSGTRGRMRRNRSE